MSTFTLFRIMFDFSYEITRLLLVRTPTLHHYFVYRDSRSVIMYSYDMVTLVGCDSTSPLTHGIPTGMHHFPHIFLFCNPIRDPAPIVSAVCPFYFIWHSNTLVLWPEVCSVHLLPPAQTLWYFTLVSLVTHHAIDRNLLLFCEHFFFAADRPSLWLLLFAIATHTYNRTLLFLS